MKKQNKRIKKEYVGKPRDNIMNKTLADKIVEIPSSRIQEKIEVSKDLDKLIEKFVKEREERINRLLNMYEALSSVMPYVIQYLKYVMQYLKLHFPSLFHLINTLAHIARTLIIACLPIILFLLMWTAMAKDLI